MCFLFFFCYCTWQFYSGCLFFVYFKVRKLNSKNRKSKKKQSLVGLTPYICFELKIDMKYLIYFVNLFELQVYVESLSVVESRHVRWFVPETGGWRFHHLHRIPFPSLTTYQTPTRIQVRFSTLSFLLLHTLNCLKCKTNRIIRALHLQRARWEENWNS